MKLTLTLPSPLQVHREEHGQVFLLIYPYILHHTLHTSISKTLLYQEESFTQNTFYRWERFLVCGDFLWETQQCTVFFFRWSNGMGGSLAHQGNVQKRSVPQPENNQTKKSFRCRKHLRWKYDRRKVHGQEWREVWYYFYINVLNLTRTVEMEEVLSFWGWRNADKGYWNCGHDK